ncbi:hypothetical protein [Rhodopirellula sp. SWK7]|uniref:hypothetical protein n=1 Tax=Rhodopirellula sp. SWK7 TaxID=595460 RepID=UPI0002BFF82A|nr:hypothetical protein [Rhodopirellula sp. SWK7]EMI40542.1 hypothetical protein RRSWK_06951 [Rhodopirellula sp. SWK7]
MATERQKTAEVNTLVMHGLALDDALDIVGLKRSRYRPGRCIEALEYLPTPSQISELCSKFQSGELVAGSNSASQWERIRHGQRLAEEAEAAIDEFDIAGSLPEDACEMPPWLYSAHCHDKVLTV